MYFFYLIVLDFGIRVIPFAKLLNFFVKKKSFSALFFHENYHFVRKCLILCILRRFMLNSPFYVRIA